MKVWLRGRGPRIIAALAAGVAGVGVGAPYATSLSVTHEAVSWPADAHLVAVVVTVVTGVLAAVLGWLASGARSPTRAAWWCAVAPALGAADVSISFAVVSGCAHPQLQEVVVAAIVGAIFGTVFGGGAGTLFGLGLIWLVRRTVSLSLVRSLDTSNATARTAGSWLTVVGSLLLVAYVAAGGSSVVYAVPPLAVGVTLFGAGYLRSRARSRWIARVEAGQVVGWRVADATPSDAWLPRFRSDGAGTGSDGVLLSVSDNTATYRDSPERVEPVALVRRP